MPFMEDPTYTNMDVDDLFGDVGDAEQVALPSMTTIPPPPVKGLARRLDELSASGCCSRIAWSKNGCVAYLSQDGYTVHLRVFARDPSTGKWDLGPETQLDRPQGHDDYKFVHISWSHLGNDLAVTNAAGHVMVFSCAMALDRMTYMRADLTQPEAEMDAVVGIHWLAILPYEQKNHIAWSATKHGNDWNFQITSHSFKDMHHPVEGKASLIYLKRQGDLKLRFQQPDNSWSEVTAPVGPMMSTREAFTHAAFASDGNNQLLLVAYDVSSRLSFYRINAVWNVPPQKHGQQPPKFYEKPDLQISEIAVEDHCYPTMVNSDVNGIPESKIRVPAQLTHLHFLPTTPEPNDGSVPTVQAIFSTPPNIPNLDQTLSQQNPFSIVTKWEVHLSQLNQLHASLDKVTSSKKTVNAVPVREVWNLKRQPDTMMHSTIVSFAPLWYNMVLGFHYSDGTIEFRKRSSMAVIGPDFNTEAVSSMSQAGFSFPVLEPSLHVALSPNYCIAACMSQEGKIKLLPMEYTYGTLSDEQDDPRHSAALAALILQSATAANQYYCSDDLFATMRDLSPARKDTFIQLMFEGLNVSIDCGIDDSTNHHLILLGRSPFFVKILSAIHLLGLDGSVNRSLTSKMSWMMLNIKYVTQILTTIARMHGQIEKNPLRAEVVPQFIGICRWITHFMVLMMDELLETGRALQSFEQKAGAGAPALTRADLEATIHSLNKPTLLILLLSFPRMMMKLWAQPLQWVMKTAYSYMSGSHSAEQRRLYHPLQQAFSETPLEYRHFEQLISEAQHLVRSCYKQFSPADSEFSHLTDKQRNACERELILGRIPEALFPAAKRLATVTLWDLNANGDCLADKLDIPGLIFFDTTWLGFTNSQRATDFYATHVVDVCQKMVIRGTGAQSHPTTAAAPPARDRSDSVRSGEDGRRKDRRLRRCVRCGAYMEDVTMGLPGYANHHVSWLMGVAKHCVCGNSWMLAPEKKRAR